MKLHRRASPLVVLGLIIALAAALAWLLPAQKPNPPATLNFTLLDGNNLALADLRGRPVLIAFWATSCAPCVEELPDLIRLYRELLPRGFEMIAVAMPYDPPLQVQNFVRRNAVPYPVALDVRGEVARAFGGIDFVPTAFLLDPGGAVLYRQVGRLDIERARRLLEPFLHNQ